MRFSREIDLRGLRITDSDSDSASASFVQNHSGEHNPPLSNGSFKPPALPLTPPPTGRKVRGDSPSLPDQNNQPSPVPITPLSKTRPSPGPDRIGSAVPSTPGGSSRKTRRVVPYVNPAEREESGNREEWTRLLSQERPETPPERSPTRSISEKGSANAKDGVIPTPPPVILSENFSSEKTAPQTPTPLSRSSTSEAVLYGIDDSYPSVHEAGSPASAPTVQAPSVSATAPPRLPRKAASKLCPSSRQPPEWRLEGSQSSVVDWDPNVDSEGGEPPERDIISQEFSKALIREVRGGYGAGEVLQFVRTDGSTPFNPKRMTVHELADLLVRRTICMKRRSRLVSPHDAEQFYLRMSRPRKGIVKVARPSEACDYVSVDSNGEAEPVERGPETAKTETSSGTKNRKLQSPIDRLLFGNYLPSFSDPDMYYLRIAVPNGQALFEEGRRLSSKALHQGVHASWRRSAASSIILVAMDRNTQLLTLLFKYGTMRNGRFTYSPFFPEGGQFATLMYSGDPTQPMPNSSSSSSVGLLAYPHGTIGQLLSSPRFPDTLSLLPAKAVRISAYFTSGPFESNPLKVNENMILDNMYDILAPQSRSNEKEASHPRLSRDPRVNDLCYVTPVELDEAIARRELEIVQRKRFYDMVSELQGALSAELRSLACAPPPPVLMLSSSIPNTSTIEDGNLGPNSGTGLAVASLRARISAHFTRERRLSRARRRGETGFLSSPAPGKPSNPVPALNARSLRTPLATLGEYEICEPNQSNALMGIENQEGVVQVKKDGGIHSPGKIKIRVNIPSPRKNKGPSNEPISDTHVSVIFNNSKTEIF